MYAENFGFRKLPFENVPDPAFFFNHGDYISARKGISDSIKKGSGLMVVTGPEGSGKTTLSQMTISDCSGDIRIVWIAEPPKKGKDLFLFIAQELGLELQTSERAAVLSEIKEALLKINADGSRYLVIMEDSHMMTDDIIEGICLLNDLGDGPSKLIQILLFAQEKIVRIINRPGMHSFRKRIASLSTIGKMDAARIRKYVLHRIEVAGGRPSVFSDTAWKALSLAFASGNTPRTINSLCDRSLTRAFKRGRTIVSVDDIYKAAEEVEIYRDDVYYEMMPEAEGRNNQTVSDAEAAPVEKSEEFSFSLTGKSSDNYNGRKETFLSGLLSHNSIKEHSKNFLFRLMNKASEKNEDGREAVKEISQAEIRTEKPEMTGRAEGIPDKSISMKTEKLQGLEVSRIMERKFFEHDETQLTSEWFTSGLKGLKAFKPIVKKMAAAEPEEWIAMDEKEPVFQESDADNRKNLSDWELYPSSEWVTAGSKVSKSFKPAHIEEKSMLGNTEAEAKHDKWVRMGKKRNSLQ